MPLLQGSSNSSNFFNLDGLDYPKSMVTLAYSNVIKNSDGDILPEEIEVGLAYAANPNKFLQKPVKVEEWIDVNTSLPFEDLETLLTSLSSLVGFNSTGSTSPSGLGLGWASYGDTLYTQASPLVIAPGVTSKVELNALNSITAYLPDGVEFYDPLTSKITPENIGDGYAISLGFRGSNSSNSGSSTLSIDIGGAIGQIFKRSFMFPRGTGINHDFFYTTQCYSLDTFVANGGDIEIEGVTGTGSYWDFNLQIHRTFSAGS